MKKCRRFFILCWFLVLGIISLNNMALASTNTSNANTTNNSSSTNTQNNTEQTTSVQEKVKIYLDSVLLGSDFDPRLINGQIAGPYGDILNALKVEVEWKDSKKRLMIGSAFSELLTKVESIPSSGVTTTIQEELTTEQNGTIAFPYSFTVPANTYHTAFNGGNWQGYTNAYVAPPGYYVAYIEIEETPVDVWVAYYSIPFKNWQSEYRIWGGIDKTFSKTYISGVRFAGDNATSEEQEVIVKRVVIAPYEGEWVGPTS